MAANENYDETEDEADERKTVFKYLYARLTESFSLDENGKFVEGTQEQVYENYPTQKFEKFFEETAQNVVLHLRKTCFSQVVFTVYSMF